MSDDLIFQASDLANKRTEVLAAARNGQARIRDKDGTSLVMLPESRLRLLEALTKWRHTYMKLEAILRRSELPKVGELGELAWLRAFDREDIQEFVGELSDALIAAEADQDTAVLDECINAWRITARQLADPLRRSVLLGTFEPEDYIEVSGPDGADSE
jgi:hypothetical protein